MKKIALCFLILLSASSGYAAEKSTLKFKYLFQYWMCSRDDDNINGCEDNSTNGNGKPKDGVVEMTHTVDDRWVGSTRLSETINSLSMVVDLRVMEDRRNNIAEISVTLKDNRNPRANLTSLLLNDLNKWNSMFSIYQHPIQDGGIFLYPEVRIFPPDFKYVPDAIRLSLKH